MRHRDAHLSAMGCRCRKWQYSSIPGEISRVRTTNKEPLEEPGRQRAPEDPRQGPSRSLVPGVGQGWFARRQPVASLGFTHSHSLSLSLQQVGETRQRERERG